MRKINIEYEVTYEAPIIIKMSELLAKCDLGIDGISSPNCEKWSWQTTSNVDTKYLKKMAGAIESAIKKSGGKLIYIKCNTKPEFSLLPIRKGTTINVYKGPDKLESASSDIIQHC
jgi:hypothetical protein